MLSAAVWRSRGVEMAQPLFSQRKSTGAPKTPATFIASWQSPSEVAPSPREATTASSVGPSVGSTRPAATAPSRSSVSPAGWSGRTAFR
jgi:hypothetical protein